MKTLAVAFFDGPKVKGTVHFEETDGGKKVAVHVNLTGLKKKGRHGIHVHEAGDLTQKCDSACAHFNPFQKNHGCRDSKDRHAGDLGNLETDAYGRCMASFEDSVIKLRGSKANILGRSLVIHADEDDCGLGGYPDSLTTGHSGKRIACAVIGYAKEMFVSK